MNHPRASIRRKLIFATLTTLLPAACRTTFRSYAVWRFSQNAG
jgi:hypothetical protein